MNLSVLVHTFNRYQHLWPGFFEAWRKHCAWWPIAVDCYFGTDETDHGPHDHRPFKILYSGVGEWSDRLKKLVEQIPEDYILYLQEDHYPTRQQPDLAALSIIMDKKKLSRLQISPVNQFYSLTGSEIPLHFHKTSKYLVSHQPSIWKKSFLLECLQPSETPWINEYEGTKRLQRKGNISGKIAIYPYDWYKHMCVRGIVQS